MKIAVAGKGGVGKTTIASLLALHYSKKGRKVLAIDADSNPNLGVTLGVSDEVLSKYIPVSENVELIRRKTGVDEFGLYRLSFRVDDIVENFCIKVSDNLSLLIVGAVRPGGGCMCPANAVIKALLTHLIIERDELVIVDMEAGLEHLGRATAKNVDYMLVVSEPTRKSLETAKKIRQLSLDIGIKKCGLILNKVSTSSEERSLLEFCAKEGLDLLLIIPYDSEFRELELKGKPITSLSSRSPVWRRIGKLAEMLTSLAQ